jgi:hypothetical protein
MAGGRPNKYDTHIKPYLRQLAILRSHGEEYDAIAKMFHIAPSTLYKHKAEVEEFSESLKKGDQLLIGELEATLYDLAKGNVVRSKTKIEYTPDGLIKSKEVTTENLAPNVAALIFSLTNLAPEKWRNKSDVSATQEIAKDMEQFNG